MVLAFDEETSGSLESTGEHYLFNNSGMMAIIGGTRFGFIFPGTGGDGPNQRFDESYFHGLFTENIRELGACLSYSKESLAGLVPQPIFRWVYYELILAGDPQVQIINGEGQIPELQVTSTTVTETIGNGDGILDPGENAEIIVSLLNNSDDDYAYSISLTVIPIDGAYEVLSNEISFEVMAPGEIYENSESPFIIQLDENCPIGSQYILQVTANENEVSYYKKQHYLPLGISWNYPGFPYETGTPFLSSPLLVDIDGDSDIEIVNGDTLGNVYALEMNGQSLPGFPVQTNCILKNSIAMGNLDDDPQLEIVLGGMEKLIAIDHNGEITFTYDNFSENFTPPTVADITDDGRSEIIVGDQAGFLYLFDGTGNFVENFPISLPHSIIFPVSVGDIDNDGSMEMVVATEGGALYAVESDGNLTNGYPIAFDCQFRNSTTIFDGDKIILTDESGSLFIVENAEVTHFSMYDHPIAHTVIPADFDGDGETELAFTLDNGEIYIIKQNGSYVNNWPIHSNVNIVGTLLPADIVHDELMDILFADENGAIHALDLSGDYIANFPIYTGKNTQATPSILDIDGNGTAEICMGTMDGITLLDIKHPCGNISTWNTFRGNMGRTGNPHFSGVSDIKSHNFSSIPHKNALKQNYPNPFNPVTNINFQLAQKSRVKLKIYDITGNLVKNLFDDETEAGYHSTNWNGKDDAGQDVPSGLYFYRIESNNFNQTKKCLLLK